MGGLPEGSTPGAPVHVATSSNAARVSSGRRLARPILSGDQDEGQYGRTRPAICRDRTRSWSMTMARMTVVTGYSAARGATRLRSAAGWQGDRARWPTCPAARRAAVQRSEMPRGQFPGRVTAAGSTEQQGAGLGAAIGHSPGSAAEAYRPRATKTKNNAKPMPDSTAVPTSRGVTITRSPGRGGARLTKAIASSAHTTPTNCKGGAAHPLISPTTTGIAAEVTAVTGATTVIAPGPEPGRTGSSRARRSSRRRRPNRTAAVDGGT